MLRSIRQPLQISSRNFSVTTPTLHTIWKFPEKPKHSTFYEKLLKYNSTLPSTFPFAQEGLANNEISSSVNDSSIAKILSFQHGQGHQHLSYNIQLAIQTFQRHEADIGSPEVQLAICTVKIMHLKEHCIHFKKDHRAARNLIELRYTRSRILRHLKKVSLERYFCIIKELRLSANEVNFTTNPELMQSNNA